MAHSQSSSTLTAIQRQLDIVLEQALHAIVCEPLTQLDNGYQPGRHGQVLCDMAQSRFLQFRGLFAVRSIRHGFFDGLEGLFILGGFLSNRIN